MARGFLKTGASCLLTVGVAVLCGCGTVYLPPDTPIPGDASAPTTYDIETSARSLVQQMLASPRFKEKYDAAKSAAGSLPVAVVGNIDNKTDARVQDRLDAAGDMVRVALYDPGLFDVKDDEAADAIKARILIGADGGLENGALVQTMGTHDSPGFIVLGDFRHFADVGGYHTYRLRLAVHDLRTGKIIWEGIQTMIKL